MAVPADITLDRDTFPLRGGNDVIKQVNNLVASFRLLTTKMDADAGITDVNYNALITDDAIATAPRKIVI